MTFRKMELSPHQARDNGNCGVFMCMIMRYLIIRRLLHADTCQLVSMEIAHKKLDRDRGRV